MNSWNGNGQFAQDMHHMPPLLPPQVPLIGPMDDMPGPRMPHVDAIGPQGMPPGMMPNDQNQMMMDLSHEDQGNQRPGNRGSRDRRDMQGPRGLWF